ncbi:quinone oxidoreductase [Geomonas subterranea]|uniref:Quinone oxidoreductase n=1 Tax=Geomonas subterranea TaxID=2847989 RepID=A0ABX8LB96_9BACT|nr:quinone oxidoreductase [Geomonas subterranea]QXE89285.1 quinone oxidoreductase [Geomonas subterranea]QXM08602.1 quinone oxidoreductase [Geomonas subterranea]
MSKAICFEQFGGPEVLKWMEVEVPEPGPGEVRIRHKAVGVNFVDVYQRSGLYKMPLPAIAGNEGAGVVEAIGDGVTLFKPGDRVAYAGTSGGGYCESRVIKADRLSLLPGAVSFEQAAAMMLKGLTVQYLVRRTYRVQAGETVVFHAAAGGVGTIACQWLRALGAKVIGTAGTEEKCELARKHGADYCINYRTENILERVKEITGGEGTAVVYDSVGKDTFETSLKCLRPRGLMVSFGNASGPVPPVDLLLLSQLGSLYLTRTGLATYIAERSELEEASAELFEMVTSGKVKVEINRTFPLKDAAQAHRELEARQTTGSTILIPD